MAAIRLYYIQLLVFFLPFVAATCYHPDGTAVTDPSYQPCVSSSGVVSMCCGTNRTVAPDVCQSNGLCLNPCTVSGQCTPSSGGQYWRESCTDSSWSSPSCLLGACTNSANGDLLASDIAISQCAIDGSWCCAGGLTSDACCGLSNRVVIAPTIGLSAVKTVGTGSPSTFSSMTTAASSTGTAYMSSTTLATSSTSPSVSNSSAPSNSSSTNGVSIGVGIGIGIGGFIVAAVMAFLLCRRRNIRSRKGPANRRDMFGHKIQGLDPRVCENSTQQHYGSADELQIYSNLAKPELDGTDRRAPRSNTRYYELAVPALRSGD